ncbi:MAG TPA: arginine--tRNA ligase [Solirubrobacteraceae bacterium]|nr:arginine--tRNA ligase [Solirubrobacteraceae bacterium]
MSPTTTEAGSGPLGELDGLVRAAAAAVRGSVVDASPQLRIERPRREGQGDYSTNAAMLLAPALGAAPREVAERIGAELTEAMGANLERVEVAGPGFLNLFLSDVWHRQALAAVLGAGERLGAGQAAPAERILLEFVSANPTGPLNAANARAAAYGDALGRILEHHGHSVWREYYFNDAGNQIRLLGESVRARARGDEVPEGGYQGEYIAELAAEIPGAADLPGPELAARAVELMLVRVKASLERYGVHYDQFFSERALHEGSPSALERTLSMLRDRGYIYESDGAVWLRTTTFDDDKDRVVVRSNGEPTYLAADVAYLEEKRERGYDRQMLPVGSDHHAYVRELKAAMAALGGDPDTVEVPILQFVHLVHEGEVFAMSKRRGDFITLDDLLDAIGVDATRFFMLRSSQDRTLDFDLELARQQSAENPVYYVQYAHARIASMLRRLPAERVSEAVEGGADWGIEALARPERDLIKKLSAFPAEVAEAAERRAPHRITQYALELAREFTAFYEACRVVGASPPTLESFRVALSVAAQRTIALSLSLLGVSAPDSM